MIERLRKQLMKDLRLCFRKSSDVGDERIEKTSPPTVTESNIGKFLVKWKNEEVENTKILSVSVCDEIEKLPVHVRLGFV